MTQDTVVLWVPCVPAPSGAQMPLMCALSAQFLVPQSLLKVLAPPSTRNLVWVWSLKPGVYSPSLVPNIGRR